MKRTPLKRISSLTKSRISEKGMEIKKRYEFFALIWKQREHKCESCGKYLGNEMRSYMFDHLLEKSKYPELAFDEDNIFLCCLECHSLKTNGHPTEKHGDAITAMHYKHGS